MKKNIWMAGLLLSGAMLPALAVQPMADMPGMQMEEKTDQAHHQWHRQDRGDRPCQTEHQAGT